MHAPHDSVRADDLVGRGHGLQVVQAKDGNLVVQIKQTDPAASILVAADRNADLLSACLGSLVDNVGPDVSYETVIVLNGSPEPVRGVVREDVSGATVVESAVNQVVNTRMCKRQQMRWSPRGAHLMLKVRTAVANDVEPIPLDHLVVLGIGAQRRAAANDEVHDPTPLGVGERTHR